jgi:hypothetical protein
MCRALPPGAAGSGGGTGQRITPGLLVQVVEPGLPQGLECAVRHHRGVLSAPQTHAAVGGRAMDVPGAAWLSPLRLLPNAAGSTALMLPLSQAVPDGETDVSVTARLTYFRPPPAYSR